MAASLLFRTTWYETYAIRQAKSTCRLACKWARLDSNQGPTDYESAALTS